MSGSRDVFSVAGSISLQAFIPHTKRRRSVSYSEVHDALSANSAILLRVSRWTPVYTDLQRSAVARAYCDLRIRPLREIQALAEAGELTPAPGAEPVESFEVTYSSVRDIGMKEERRKRGDQLPAELARQKPRDRAQALQLRLTAIADRELTRLERDQAKHPSKALDAAHASKVARLLKDLATLPDPHERALPAGTPGTRANPDTLASQLLAASDQSATLERTNGHAAPDDTQQPVGDEGRDANASASANADTDTNDDTRSDRNDHEHHNNDETQNAPDLRAGGVSSGLTADGLSTRVVAV